MSIMNEDATSPITFRLFETFRRSGVQYAVVSRARATQQEAEAYAYGNTLVLPVWGDYGVYLLAITNGHYVDYQEGRYQSGLWSFTKVDTVEEADKVAEEFINYVVFGGPK